MKVSKYPHFPKVIQGKRYSCDSAYTTKTEARAKEAKLKSDGYATRIHTTRAGGVRIYEVYKRK